MKNKREFIIYVVIGLCALIIAQVFAVVYPSRISSSVNDLPYWYVYSFSKKAARPLKIIGIAVDDYSLKAVGQRWPWKRTVYADLVSVLAREKVKVIGFDFVFAGESDDPADDITFADTIRNSPARIVLAYTLDTAKNEPLFPINALKISAYSLGMLNTPVDKDDISRRLRISIQAKDALHYSFSLMLASAYLNQRPEDIAQAMPQTVDNSYYINFLVKPKDIAIVSFYDVLNNMPKLKKLRGDDFFKDALVIIYPQAEIQHDVYTSPLGKMAGGFLHINGVADILTGRFLKQINVLLVPFIIISFIAICGILIYTGFITGLLLASGILILNFWALTFLWLQGVKFSYFYISLFIIAFFTLGSLYKYVYFFVQMLKIKSKATLDPLRNLYTLRYFYYRLSLEMKKIYLRKGSFLIFVYLEGFKDANEGTSINKLRDLWQAIAGVIHVSKGFWSVYSPDEIVGFTVGTISHVQRMIKDLRRDLNSQFLRKNLNVRPRVVSVKFYKRYPVVELLSILSKESRAAKDDNTVFQDDYVAKLVEPYESSLHGSDKLLESIDQDIEEKNTQLLGLIDDLNKEHAKTKEAFFQIITSLVNALEARDAYTEGHSERVCRYALMLADNLGWDGERKEKLRKASLLHDLGKIGIPDGILHKKGRLTDEEFDFIRQHEIIGVKILKPLKEFEEILPWILYHHERWDGKGYPHGLAGEAIPKEAQVISVADVFDALTTGRDYKPAFSLEDSINEIVKNKGLQFNPHLVDLFVELVTKNPPKG